MSDTAENLDLPATIDQQQAAHTIMNYFWPTLTPATTLRTMN